MAIYGLNFNRTEIPDGVRRKFARKWRIAPRVYLYLQGVGQSPEERDMMLVQANNGHRRLHVEVRKTPAGEWYGIYCS